MMKKPFVRLLVVFSVLVWLGACATATSPYGGAPVVDRSIGQSPKPAEPPKQPPVEVKPLRPPEPIVAQQETAPVVPADPYSQPAQPAEPPASQVSAQTPQQPAAPASAPEPPQPPAEISRQGNQAVVALLDSAANYVSAGELDRAAASLERALRIEPKNAGIWHDLGQIRLHQRQYQQAESLASKSNSLAGANEALKARNWRLIYYARRAVGDSEGADAAEAQAVLLER